MTTSSVSPKATAGAAGAALASLVVLVVTAIWPDLLTETQAAGLIAAGSVVLAFGLAWLVPDPQRNVAVVPEEGWRFSDEPGNGTSADDDE